VQDTSIELVQCDLTKMEDCTRSVAGMDYVFLCAANTSGAAVMRTNPLAHVTPNVVMNAQMLAAAYEAHVKKVLFISSSAAYPPTDDRPVKEDEMFGGDPYEVYYSVGWMKRYAEILCKIYSQKVKNPMPVVVVRPSNAYGPYDKFDPGKSHVTAALLQKVILRNDPIEVWGTGDDQRDLIYIDDLVDGMIKAMEKEEVYNAYNIAEGKVYSVKEILNTVIKLDGYQDAKIVFDPSKPTTIPTRVIDTSKSEQMLGFKPKIDLEEGLQHTIHWYKQNILKQN